ncbi:nuclear transport factor 2 family protein [Halobacterium rubrum]|uniref:nuclear transport factor 2 family protein n=1 Tax=Halobacterium TaxID=2239 RepID=UPI001F1E61C4|nr:nuclear transport factor 2 family protein [Halobacterium rubrum]MDH5019302.1 nuclear transport factor 2 family protein [Halobacterium rubrum]
MSENSDSPETVVDRQLVAYNDGDVDAFVAEFSADAVVTGFDDEEPMAVGEREIRELYGQQFEAVSPEAEVLSRIALGEYVVDHERVEQGGEEMEAVGVYRIVDGEIVGLWLAHE